MSFLLEPFFFVFKCQYLGDIISFLTLTTTMGRLVPTNGNGFLTERHINVFFYKTSNLHKDLPMVEYIDFFWSTIGILQMRYILEVDLGK